MTDHVDINGATHAQFAGVRDTLAELFATNAETGCQVAVTVNGETVVDLWAGVEPHTGAPVTDKTLIPVFSISKAVCALVIAMVVDEGVIDYDQPVADLWPDFAAQGKGEITVAETLSHQAGLPGFAENWSAEAWYDWDKTTAALAAMTPMWTPGTQPGYHAITWGYLAGEIVRRACGRTIGQELRARLGDPFDLDMWIGLPEHETHRAATPRKPSAAPDTGPANAATKAGFYMPWSSPRAAKGREKDWLTAEIPAANGHGTALSVAQAVAPLANAGVINGVQVVSGRVMDALTAERIAGDDLVLSYNLSWAAGLIRNTTTPPRRYYGPGARSVGHTGSGGSCVLADPDARLTLAFATLRHSPVLVEDERAQALIAATYRALR